MNLYKKIISESMRILVVTSTLGIVGGIMLQSIEARLFTIVSLLVILPALNNLIGAMGTIIAAKFTTLLFLGEISDKKIFDKKLLHLFRQILAAGMISVFVLCGISFLFSFIGELEMNLAVFWRITAISVVTTAVLLFVMFVVNVVAGFFVYKKNQDPDNFLIPISTMIADVVTILVFALMVNLLFVF